MTVFYRILESIEWFLYKTQDESPKIGSWSFGWRSDQGIFSTALQSPMARFLPMHHGYLAPDLAESLPELIPPSYK
jgi:hypothetical protein